MPIERQFSNICKLRQCCHYFPGGHQQKTNVIVATHHNCHRQTYTVVLGAILDSIADSMADSMADSIALWTCADIELREVRNQQL